MNMNSQRASSMDFSSRLSRPLPRWMQACKWLLELVLSLALHLTYFGCQMLLQLASIVRLPSDIAFKNRKNGDLKQLSSDGHFLKGSSATLGLTKIKDSCEKIQHYGALKDEAGNPSNLSSEECLSRIGKILKVVKIEYQEAEKALKRFYHDPN